MATTYADLPHLGPQARSLLDRLVASGEDGVRGSEPVDWGLARLLKLGYAVENPRDRSMIIHTPEGLHRWQTELLAEERRAADKLRRQIVRERLEARFKGFQFAPAGPGPLRPVRIEPFRLVRQRMPTKTEVPAPRRMPQPADERLQVPVKRFTSGLTVVPHAVPIDPELSDATLEEHDADQPEAAAEPAPPVASRRWIYGAAAVAVGAAAASVLLFIHAGENDSARPEPEHPTIVAGAQRGHAAAATQARLPATPQPAREQAAAAPAKLAEATVPGTRTSKTAPVRAIVRARPEPMQAAAAELTSPARQGAAVPVPPVRVADQAGTRPAAHEVPNRMIMSGAQASAPQPTSLASAPEQTAPARPAAPGPETHTAAIETPRQSHAEPAPHKAKVVPATEADDFPRVTPPAVNPSPQPVSVPQPATIVVAESAPPTRAPGDTGSAQVYLIPRASGPAEESQPVLELPPTVAATSASPAPSPELASGPAPQAARGEPEAAVVAALPSADIKKDHLSPALALPESAAPIIAENTAPAVTGLAASAAPASLGPGPAPASVPPQLHFGASAPALTAAIHDHQLPTLRHEVHPAAAAEPAHSTPKPASTDHEQVERLNAQSLAAAMRGQVWRPSVAVRLTKRLRVARP